MRQTVGLDNDVLYPEWLITNLEVGPCCTLVPTKLDTLHRLLVISDNNKSAVVTDLIDVAAWPDRPPGHTTVAGHVQILLIVVLAKSSAKISCAEHDTNSRLR